MYHCLFEQSGTFKNEFKKLGYEAQDYDIRNDFNETDYVIDLFNEINVAYERERERVSLISLAKKIQYWLSFLALVLRHKYYCILEGKHHNKKTYP